MAVAATPSDKQTLADILERLGGISPARVRMPPYPASVDDVVEIEEHEDRLFELVDGVLVEKVMGYLESRIATILAAALLKYVEQDDLGVVTGPDGMIRLPENLVRMPDVAFASWD